MVRKLCALLFSGLILIATEAPGHPGSGIVVDRHGNVYFVDTGSGIWKIDRQGVVTRIPGPAYHWMAIDIDGRLKDVDLPNFSAGGAVVTRAGSNPTLLLSSDFPIVVGSDGSLYYPWLRDDKQLRVFRLAPGGATNVFKTIPAHGVGEPPHWLNGIAITADGSLYYSEDRAVRRMTRGGAIVAIAKDVTVSDCDPIPGIVTDDGPYLRGLDADSHGTVYVAAAGCGAVLKITADGKVSTALRSTSPWSPTGIAVSGDSVYVLEYFHTVGDDRREWYPRVRKLTSDGRVVTVATITRR